MNMTAPWYRSDVKPKDNLMWTDKERKMILDLRHQKQSSQEIAHMFGVSLTIIYNQTRLARRRIMKQCFQCGHTLTEDEQSDNVDRFIKICTNCRTSLKEYKRERREHFLNQGICGYCEKRPVVPQKSACLKCLSATYRRRIKKGICGNCGRNPVRKKGKSLCETCTKNFRIYGRIYRKTHHHHAKQLG